MILYLQRSLPLLCTLSCDIWFATHAHYYNVKYEATRLLQYYASTDCKKSGAAGTGILIDDDEHKIHNWDNTFALED